MPFGQLVNEADTRLRDWLDRNAPKPGTRLPSERALAAQLDLQHYAINRAMSRLIAEGRVERDGYKLFVSSPSRGSTANLACHLVIAKRSIHLSGYKRVAKEMGVRLIIHSWESNGEALHMLDRIETNSADAVVFDPPYMSPPSLWAPATARLTKLGMPVIIVNQAADTLCSILSDGHHDLMLAITHLTGLGHRRLGLVTDAPATPSAAEVIHDWENICRRRGLAESVGRVHLQRNSTRKEESRETAELLAGDWSDVTALVVFSGLDCNLQQLIDQLAQRGRQVPKHLSLVFVGGAKSPATSVPPVTTITTDMPLILETTFALAQRAARKKRTHGMLPSAGCLRLQSQLHVRGSTRPLMTAPAADAGSEPAVADRPAPRPADTGRALESCLRTPYPLAAKASLSERPRFAPVDLSGLVNRPLNFRRGWLGDLPLKHFAPGPHEIHGVPFDILGGPRRTDCGAIVFHSAVNTTGNSQPLPDRLVIPIGCKAKAVYVLHGCGYAKFMHAFARYEFRHGKTSLGAVPIVSLGQPPHDYEPAARRAETLEPNIQDWWPDFPHMDFPCARMAPIVESDEGGHLPRHVYLYTLEWINPRPEKSVDSLEITVDSSLSTTLGVLAVTAVKP